MFVYNKEKEVYLLRNSSFYSEGTKKLFLYLGWIITTLDQERVISIDEFNTKLYLLIVDYIVKFFNSIIKNPNNAQLVATAHNLMLMDGILEEIKYILQAKINLVKVVQYLYQTLKMLNKMIYLAKNIFQEFVLNF